MIDTTQERGITYASVREERLVFFLVFVGVLSLTYGLFFAVDFLPEKPELATTSDVEANEAVAPRLDFNPDTDTTKDVSEVESVSGEAVSAFDTDISEETKPDTLALSNDDVYPLRIIIPTLDGRSMPVLNPTSRSVEVLDAELLKGVVRHPDSADFERVGTIVLFGHSSYLPNVMNKNFQAFNGIQKLAWGDLVTLESETREYVYRVDRVYKVSADYAEVKIETGKPKLTLVTCDSFGAKSDRFVVEATLIEETERKV